MGVLKYKQSDGTYAAITNINVVQNVAATDSVLGLVKIGYKQSGTNYPVNLDTNNLAYVTVPAYTFTSGTNGTFTINFNGSTSTISVGKTSTAETADKLGTDNGSATLPVYFKNGVPVACTNSLMKSSTSEDYLTVDANGISITGIDDIATQVNDLATQISNIKTWVTVE